MTNILALVLINTALYSTEQHAHVLLFSMVVAGNLLHWYIVCSMHYTHSKYLEIHLNSSRHTRASFRQNIFEKGVPLVVLRIWIVMVNIIIQRSPLNYNPSFFKLGLLLC